MLGGGVLPSIVGNNETTPKKDPDSWHSHMLSGHIAMIRQVSTGKWICLKSVCIFCLSVDSYIEHLDKNAPLHIVNYAVILPPTSKIQDNDVHCFFWRMPRSKSWGGMRYIPNTCTDKGGIMCTMYAVHIRKSEV